MQTPLFQPHHGPAVKGEMSSREDTPEPSTSAASTSQAAGATPPDDSREEEASCPECRHISTACSSSCRHCFCQLCLWDWSLGEATCPRCQRPTRHPYPQHVALYHEVQDRVYDRKRRRRGHSARSWSFGPSERRPRRSVRWPRDGRRQSRRRRGSDSPRRRWWQQQRRAWEDTPEEGQTPRLEWAIPVSSQGRRSRRGSRRSWSQQERSWGHRRWSRGRERSHGWDRSSRREQDMQTGSPEHSTRHRRWRSWDGDDRHPPGPQHGVPSDRSETRQSEDSDSSEQHTRGRQSRGRSHQRGQNSQAGSQRTVPYERSRIQRRWRSWDADGRHSPRPHHDTPLRRSDRHQRADWGSSRQQHATRSRTRGRSYRRSQNSRRASQGRVPRNHSTGQRQWRSWNDDQGQAPRSQRDNPGSSGRSRRRSRAGHRDT